MSTKKRSLRIDEELDGELVKWAEAEHRTVNNLIETVLLRAKGGRREPISPVVLGTVHIKNGVVMNMREIGGGQQWFGIRPEHVLLGEDGRLPGVDPKHVEWVLQLGEDMLVYAGGFIAKRPASEGWQVGQDTFPHWLPENEHWFVKSASPV